MEIAAGLLLLGAMVNNNIKEDTKKNNIINDIHLFKEQSIEENRKKYYNLIEDNYDNSIIKNSNMITPIWRDLNYTDNLKIKKELSYKINKELTSFEKINKDVISIEGMNSDSEFSDDNNYNYVNNKIKTRIDVNMDSDNYDSGSDCDETWNSQYKPMTLKKKNIPRTSNYYNEEKSTFNQNNRYFNNNQVESSKFGENLDGRYGVTPDMTHNNMMPFFKSKSYGFNPEFDKKITNNSVRNVELFTGSDQMLQFKHSREVKALFDPVVNRVDSVTGTPNFNDFKQSRVIPSDQRQGEKPFQPVLVNPGLNLGYYEAGNAGFQDMYRAYPKTVDELRTLNNPKVSYTPPVIQGQKGERMASIGITNKNKQERFFENSIDSMIPNSSIEVAPPMHGKFDVKLTSRALTGKNTYLAPARGNDKATPEYLQGQFNPGFKESFESRPNGVAGAMKQSMPLINYLNMIPDNTKRNLIENTKHISNISNSVKSYLFNSINAIPDETLRSIISDKINITNVKGNYEGTSLHNYEDTPDTTLRNLTEQNVFLKPLSGPEKSYLFNKINAIPDPTLRDLLNTAYGSAGVGFKGNHDAGILYNYEDTPDTTLRNLTENTKHISSAYTGNQHRNYNYDSIPDNTMRNLIENNNHISGINGNDKHRLFNYDDIPDITIREQTGPSKNISGIKGHNQNRSRSDVNNMVLNDKKEVLFKRRPPTLSNKNKGYTTEFTQYEFKNDDNSTTDTRNSCVKSNLGISNPYYM